MRLLAKSQARRRSCPWASFRSDQTTVETGWAVEFCRMCHRSMAARIWRASPSEKSRHVRACDIKMHDQIASYQDQELRD
jgi:hypothetical protein